MPKIVNHDTIREEILLRCFDVFADHGYTGVTMRSLAQELELSTGSIYHYFPTKHSILEALFQILINRDREQLLAIIGYRESQSQRIDLFFQFFIEREEYFKKLLLLSIDYYRHAESEDYLAVLKKFAQYYCDVISEGIGLSFEHSSLIFIFCKGIIYNRLLFKGMVSLNDQCDRFKNMLRLQLEEEEIIKTECSV